MNEKINLGRVGFMPKGAYNPDTTYKRLAVVTYKNCTYASRKDGNVGHEPVGDDEWWQRIVDGQTAYDGAVKADNAADRANTSADEAERINNNVQTAENVRIASEKERTENESTRISSENERIDAEDTRTEAERIRVSAERQRDLDETQRKAKEDSRTFAESSRNSNEAARVSAENARAEAESNRVANETARKEAETYRSSAEDTRKESENVRTTKEEGRVTAENARVTSETARVDAENNRVYAETERAKAEAARVEAESNRVTAENLRVGAETKREKDFASSQKACDDATAASKAQTEACKTATDNAKTQTSAAQSAANAATDAKDAANAATTKATEATKNANSATDKANAATAKADTATANANAATTRANNAATDAENVNATITTENVLEVTDRTGAKKSLTLADTASTAKKLTELSEVDIAHEARLSSLEQAVGDLGGTVDRYYIGSQDTTKASPDIVEASTNVGKQMLQDMYRPFLINHEDAKEGVEVMPAKEMKRNNVLRFKDNSFAPAVGITEEMRAQCDVELYLDAEHTQKYCDAGAFDAEKFYNDYGFTQKLYDASGNEIEHVLRPWETTSKNYSIKVGDPTVNYLLDDYPASEPDTLYRGILKSYREYKGMKPNKLAPTLISPCCDTSIKDVDGKIRFRSFFFLYNPCDNNTKGSLGSSGLNMFYDNGAYPRVNDVNQVTSMDYARNNNFDKTKTYPFAEMGFHSYNTFVCAHELLYGTNYINDPDNLFSSGTSSDDSCNNEAAWNKYGGVRIKMGDGDWKYLVYAQTSDLLYKDANGTKMADNMSIFVNTEYPKWRCNEALIALSFAVEMGVPENTEFEVYGTKYWYVTPPKVKGIADGYLNARVYRKVAGEWQGYDASGNAQVFTVEVVLRDGLMDGVSTSGDIFHYRGGGYEQVAEVLVQQSESKVGYPTDLYIEINQRKWHSERTQSKINKGVFDFESQYKNVGRQESTQTGWLKKRCGNTLMEAIAGGGGSNSYAAAFNDNNNYFSNTVGDRVRKGVRGGGNAYWSNCASRSLNAFHSVLAAHRYYGGSAQVLFQCK